MRHPPRPWLRILALLLVTAAAAAQSGDQRRSSEFGRVAVPQPAKPADAAQCVEPVEVMRRDHMKFLLRQRDEAVIEGKRDGKYGLVECLNCHNPGDSSPEVRYEDPGHFCADCHVYTGVRIDCFECHADRGMQTPADGRRAAPGRAPAWADRGKLSALPTARESIRVD